MAFKDLLDQAKNHPTIVTVALFSCLVIGAFGSVIYLKINEQRTGLLGDKVAQLELDASSQRKINKVIQNQIMALKHGYQNLPTSLNQIKGEFESLFALNILNDAKKKQVQGIIHILATEVNNVEIALEKSEMLLKTFEEFLNASLAEQQGNYVLAVNLYTVAAELGNIDAQYRLGTMYAGGRGVEVDYSKAWEWYQKASLEGNAGARAELAQLYETGLGVKTDLVAALAIYKSLQNDAPLSANAKIHEFSKVLSPEQLRLAEEQAEIYIEKNNDISPYKSIQQIPDFEDIDGQR